MSVFTCNMPGAELLLVMKDGEALGGVQHIDVGEKTYTRIRFDILCDDDQLPSLDELDHLPTRDEAPNVWEDGVYDSLRVNLGTVSTEAPPEFAELEALLLAVAKRESKSTPYEFT